MNKGIIILKRKEVEINFIIKFNFGDKLSITKSLLFKNQIIKELYHLGNRMIIEKINII